MPAVNTTGLSRHRLSPYNAYYLKYTTLYLYSPRFHVLCDIFFKSVNRVTINTTVWQGAIPGYGRELIKTAPVLQQENILCKWAFC